MSSHPEPSVPDLTTWVKQNGGLLQQQAYWFTRDEKLAEEIGQEAAIKVMKAWVDDEKRELILTSPRYLRKIVLNSYLDHIKVPSRTRLNEVELDVERHDGAQAENDLMLHVAMLALDEDERNMIELRYYNDLTIKEVGIQLGLSTSQAHRLHRKALKHLKGLLTEGED